MFRIVFIYSKSQCVDETLSKVALTDTLFVIRNFIKKM